MHCIPAPYCALNLSSPGPDMAHEADEAEREAGHADPVAPATTAKTALRHGECVHTHVRDPRGMSWTNLLNQVA